MRIRIKKEDEEQDKEKEQDRTRRTLDHPMADLVIYGANGYTGDLIAREATARGYKPVLAGRNAAAVGSLARELGLEHRVFGLDQPQRVEENLRGVKVVLHCAGPFAHTFQPMAEACLRGGVHYLDITGEIGVFEALAGRGEEAKSRGVMLLPGAGFDVVPTDCLAAHLKKRHPAATHLALAIQSRSRLSRGTATTIVENIHGGGLVRENGVLRRVPAAWKTRTIDFGAGPVKTMTIPWGDLATAYRNTGIPNIEVYAAASRGLRVGARLSRYLGWLLSSGPGQRFLKGRIRAGPPGPSAEERASGYSLIWGEVTDAAGNKATARLRGPEGYTFTVRAALAIAQRVLAGDAAPGYQTPATAYGPDFVLGLEGVTRADG